MRRFFTLYVVLTALLFASASCSKVDPGPVLDPFDDGEQASSDSVYDNPTWFIAKTTQETAPNSPSQAQIIPSTEVATLESDYLASEPQALFNGKDLSGWVNETGGEPKGWTVESGLLRLVDPQNGGDIITDKSFINYILTFEWRFGTACNSGVKYKIEQPNGKGWIGLEYQIQDDANVPDGKIANRTIASLFDVFPARPSSKAERFPTPNTAEPSGDFRTGKIVVADNRVEHWIDGERVLAFTIDSNEWNAAKAKSKFKNQKTFGLVSESPILLQAHGSPIDFKSVTIQTLTRKAEERK